MPRARLTLHIPDGVWVGDLSRSHPDVTFRVLTVLPDDGGGVALLELTGEGVDAALAALGAREEVVESTALHHGDGEALVQFETSEPVLLLPVQGSGTPLELPFDLADGRAQWTVTAPHERLSTLGDQLAAFGIPFDVAYVREDGMAESVLTDTQRELLETAVEAGYYDSPRTCSLTELAEEVGAAKSTVSETLHRAEGAVVRAFLDAPRPPPAAGPD